MIRVPAVSGSFYPADKKKLAELVDVFIAQAPDLNLAGLKGVIVPHAGYLYSGATAGVAYRQFKNFPKKHYRIFLLGPAHQAYTTTSVGNFTAYETPLGKVPVDSEICKQLLKNPELEFTPEADLPEHCLEVQLPFLQRTFADFSIIPILCGTTDPQMLAKILQPFFGQENNLFVISSDLSHYLSGAEAQIVDAETLNIVTSLELKNAKKIDACGKIPIQVAMQMEQTTDGKIKLLAQTNSGAVTGDDSAVVGYAALALL